MPPPPPQPPPSPPQPGWAVHVLALAGALVAVAVAVAIATARMHAWTPTAGPATAADGLVVADGPLVTVAPAGPLFTDVDPGATTTQRCAAVDVAASARRGQVTVAAVGVGGAADAATVTVDVGRGATGSCAGFVAHRRVFSGPLTDLAGGSLPVQAADPAGRIWRVTLHRSPHDAVSFELTWTVEG